MDFTTFEIRDRKAYITLNRPEKRNALSPDLVGALKDDFKRAAEADDVKVIILKSEGKAFCAGADLEYLQNLQNFSPEENHADSNHLKELLLQIYEHRKPVIAQVEGHAIAGGCGLATVCDFVYAVDQAMFGYTEVKIGFVPAMVMLFLIRKIGESRASELLLSGQLVDAEEAFRLGIVHKVCSRDSIVGDVERLAVQLVDGNSGASMTLTKQLIKTLPGMDLEEALNVAAETNAKARTTEDCKKGISAFLNKQSLKW